MEQKIIYSEQLLVSVNPTEILTVLGSCVAVCLYDKKNKFGAMNHFLIPLWNGSGLKSLKFGNISTARLIEGMESVGSDVRDLEAKLFGGAMLNLNDKVSVGARNIQIAEDILKHYKIPIRAKDVGGNRGRKVIFSTATGDVYVKYSK